MTGPSGRLTSCSPSHEQELLLQAALLKGPKSLEAWEEWKSLVPVDDVDPGSYRLLPLLHFNLRAQGVNHPLLNCFKGIHRQIWYQNQILFNKIAAVLRSFHAGGVKTIALKGAALILRHYRDYGLRPMQDFDILIPRHAASTAIDLLDKLDWRSRIFPPRRLQEAYLSVHRALVFEDPLGHELDLHVNPLPPWPGPDPEDDYWEVAEPARLNDVPLLVPSPADLLLEVCAHGVRWNSIPPHRWVADAMAILNSCPDVDWDRLMARAGKRRLAIPITQALAYLSERMQAPVPPDVLEALRKLPVSSTDRFLYNTQICPMDSRTPVSELHLLFLELRLKYLRFCGAENKAGPFGRLTRVPRFLQLFARLNRLRQVPFWLVSGAMRRVWKIPVWYRKRLILMFSPGLRKCRSSEGKPESGV